MSKSKNKGVSNIPTGLTNQVRELTVLELTYNQGMVRGDSKNKGKIYLPFGVDQDKLATPLCYDQVINNIPKTDLIYMDDNFLGGDYYFMHGDAFQTAFQNSVFRLGEQILIRYDKGLHYKGSITIMQVIVPKGSRHEGEVVVAKIYITKAGKNRHGHQLYDISISANSVSERQYPTIYDKNNQVQIASSILTPGDFGFLFTSFIYEMVTHIHSHRICDYGRLLIEHQNIEMFGGFYEANDKLTLGQILKHFTALGKGKYADLLDLINLIGDSLPAVMSKCKYTITLLQTTLKERISPYGKDDGYPICKYIVLC